jgi:hypothetical protein
MPPGAMKELIPEFMMYNFDIDIGDTVLVPQYANGPYSTGYVEEADSLLIGTEYHKRYFIQCWEWHSMHIIEGVGSDLGLIYFDIPWVDVYGDLYCFSLNDTIFSTDVIKLHLCPGYGKWYLFFKDLFCYRYTNESI